MRRLGSDFIILAAGLTMVSATAVLAANEASAPNAPARMTMTVDGPMLVAANGKTVYTNPAERDGKPTCSNVADSKEEVMRAGDDGAKVLIPSKAWPSKACTEKWPPYLADASAQPAGDFGLVDRPEGGKQWTYQNKPLYFSVRDKAPGDRWGASFQFTTAFPVANAQGGGRGGGGFGRGAGGFRYASIAFEFPPIARLARYENDLVLTSANGRPLFTPKKGANLELLTPVLAPDLAKVTGDWSLASSGDGRKLYAFRNMPLYSLPDGVHLNDVVEAGGWDTVVFEKGVAPPSDIQTRLSFSGDVYTNKDGLTLYQFSCSRTSGAGAGGFGGGGGGPGGCDDPGDAAGYWAAICGSGAECAKRWKPYIASAEAKPSGEWSIQEVSVPLFTDPQGTTYPPNTPRVRGWHYRGKPVFTYYEDKQAGEIWGHGINWPFGGSSMNAVQPPGRAEGRGG